MKTFGIAREGGAVLADNLGCERAARHVAQMAANMRGERVWLYEENVFAPAEAVEPERVSQ
jgi:hypothetical protein